MIIVQMGFLSDALDFVYNKILDPAFDFINDMLNTILTYLFNTVLTPVLDSVLGIAIDFAVDLIWEFLALRLLMVEQGVLLILDVMQKMFNIYIGLTPVTNTETGAEGSLMLILLRHSLVINVMLRILFAGFVFTFLCAIFATIRAAGNLEVRQDRTVAHVVRETGRAMLRFVMAPVMAIFLILMADAILHSLNGAFTGDTEEPFSLARTIFCISTLDAVDTKKFPAAEAYNSSTGMKGAIDDTYREAFYNPPEDGKVDYYLKTDIVLDTFNVKKIDFLLGILLAILFVLILLIADLYAIERIFGVLVLLFVEPFFIATMPLDDGKRFDKWQELFFGKLFSAYGIVIGMNLYLVLMGALFGNKLSFLDPTQLQGKVYDYIVKLIFMIGCGFALWVTASLVTSIISPEVAQQEQQTMAKAHEKAMDIKKKAEKAAKMIAAVAATVATGGAAAPAAGAAA
nr:hypothetical protein [Lachnospiraceae bacterium]